MKIPKNSFFRGFIHLTHQQVSLAPVDESKVHTQFTCIVNWKVKKFIQKRII